MLTRWLDTPGRRVPVGAAIILRAGFDGSPFVVLKRTGAHGEGTWSLPGGWVEKGEDPAFAAAREAWEEVGVNVAAGMTRFVGYTADSHPEGIFGVTLWYEAFRDSWHGVPRPTHPERVAEVRVLALEDVPHPRFVAFANGITKGLVK